MTSTRHHRSSHGHGGHSGHVGPASQRRSVEEVPDVITIADTEEEDNADEDDAPVAFLNEVPAPNEVKQNVRRRALKRKHPQKDGCGGAEMSVVVFNGAEVSLPSRSKSPRANNKENYRLQELIRSHMGLIKQQSEDIVEKDRKLRDLQRENEKLKQRLLQMEVFKGPASPPSSPSCSSADAVYGGSKIVKDECLFVPPMQITRKLSVDKAVGTDIIDVVDPLALDSDEFEVKVKEEQEKEIKKEETAEKPLPKGRFLECSYPYFVLQGEDYVAQERREIAEILSQSEVPGWRENPLASIYSMEGTEDIEDVTILKRHSKPETDEKRRKRWDSQRLREQRNVERLRARYDPQRDEKKSSKKATEWMPKSLINPVPIGERLTQVVVTESLPVSAFGFQLPALQPSTFSLPWLSGGAHRKRK